MRPLHRPKTYENPRPQYWHITGSMSGVFTSREHGHHDIIELAHNAAEKVLPVFCCVGWRGHFEYRMRFQETLTCALDRYREFRRGHAGTDGTSLLSNASEQFSIADDSFLSPNSSRRLLLLAAQRTPYVLRAASAEVVFHAHGNHQAGLPTLVYWLAAPLPRHS